VWESELQYKSVKWAIEMIYLNLILNYTFNWHLNVLCFQLGKCFFSTINIGARAEGNTTLCSNKTSFNDILKEQHLL